MNERERVAYSAAQDAMAVAKAWLDHYTKGEPRPDWPLSDFDNACETFFDALGVRLGEHA